MQVPTWTLDSQNPINQFIPSQEQPFKPPVDYDLTLATEERMMRLSQVLTRDARGTLVLAGTSSLKNRAMSPLSKLK